jgi:hypothetical protein
VIAVAVTTGIILVTVAVVIALARKRGMFQHPASRNEMSGWVCDTVIVECKRAVHAVYMVTAVDVSRY